MKSAFIILIMQLTICIAHQAYGQFTTQWVHRAGSTSGDAGTSVATDASGNIYVAGYFTGTVDFDPGPAVFDLSAVANNDAFLAKYNASGVFLWAISVGGTDTDIAEAVTTDASGNIYISINFGSVIDMDPGPGVANFTTPGFDSGILGKYDANGNYIWAIPLLTPASSGISDIAIDAANNIFITGAFHGTVDFDPGTAVANLTSSGNADIFFAKYDVNGNYQFAKSIGAGAFDVGFFIEVDGIGSILISGYYRLTVDFDPGAGVANLTAVGSLNDVFFAKYDANGNYLWARSIGASPNDIPGGIMTDASNNVIVTGGFSGTVDFDPGPTVVNLTPTGTDIFIAKYDANGNYIWAKGIGSTGTDASYALTGDGNGGFYISGEFGATVDFNPGAAITNITSNGNSDIFFARYNADGNFLSAGNVGGSSSDYSQDMELVDADNVLITGFFFGSADFDPGPGVNTLISAGVSDIFFGKFSSNSGSLPVTLSSFKTNCTVDGATLYWTSSQEQNSLNYIIEKSYNGVQFEMAGTVTAIGNSTVATHYTFTDKTNRSQKTFYRLRQNDNDGKFVYSKTIVSNCASSASVISIYPNPVINELTIVSRDPIQKITVYDVGGRVVNLIKQTQNKIDTRQLKKGMYILRIETIEGIFLKNFVKQ